MKRLALIFLIFATAMIPAVAQQNKMEKQKETGYAAVNGINMYYEIHGSGKIPLVLIHGGGSTIESTFGTILPMLTKKHQVIAIELQAHGRTSDRNTPESFEQDADDVAALLKYLKVAHANMLGFSNGGTTTLQFAIRHPSIVDKIVVISANYQREGMLEGFFDGMQHATIAQMPAQLKTSFLKVTPDQNKLQTMFEKDRNRMINFKDIPDELIKSINASTLLVVGDKDVVTVSHVMKMSNLLPKAKFAVLPGSHGSFIGEICTIEVGSKMPEITVALINEFLMK